MNKKEFIATQTLCSSYNIELSFLDELHKMRLIKIEVIEQNQFIHHDQIGEVEKIIRLYQDLNLSLEGIDVVLNLLEKERALRREVTTLRNRLKLYESE